MYASAERILRGKAGVTHDSPDTERLRGVSVEAVEIDGDVHVYNVSIA